MEYDKLKSKSVKKILLRAKSGRGKTITAAKVSLEVSKAGGEVLYVDTEAEGSTSMVALVEDESTDYTPGDVDNIEYVRADSYTDLMENIHAQDGRHTEFDLIVVDTLDHKHSYVLKHVTDAKREAGADWNEYAAIYSEEKEMMEQIGKPKTNILATLDPESGSMDKPKGAQTNIHGYFTAVIDLKKNGDEYSNSVRNWVNRDDLIGNAISNLDDAVTKELTEAMDL